MTKVSPWPNEWILPQNLSPELISDGEQYHRALFHDGVLLQPRSWHRETFEHLIALLRPYLQQDSVGLDYASGTGGSSLPLLDFCEAEGINITLALTDVLPSWFYTAYQLLHSRPQAKFFLLDLKAKQPLLGVFGRARFNFIVSASTLHLLPESKLDAIFKELYEMLAAGGVLVYNSGDVGHPDIGDFDATYLHEVYRIARDLLHGDTRYLYALEELEKRDPELYARVVKTHNVFPDPLPIDRFQQAFSNAGFRELKLERKVIEKKKQDALDFIQVERLTNIAGAIANPEIRREMIAEYMEKALAKLIIQGSADVHRIRTLWTFGLYQKQ